jgi:lipase
LLAQRVRCLCPDLVGYGAGARFDRDNYSFRQEMQIVEYALESASRPSILVGHSFGGVVALAVAMARPELVARLVLIEPVAFTLLDSEEHRSSHVKLLRFCNKINELVGLGNLGEAAETFFSFWEISDIWHALDAKRQKAIELLMPKVAAECALIHAPEFTVSDITRRLAVPTLVIHGSQSPHLAREVCKVVVDASSYCTATELPGANHLSPLLQPKELAAVIENFSAQDGEPGRHTFDPAEKIPLLPIAAPSIA